MERIKLIVKRFLAPPAILLIFIAAMTLTGCAVIETQRITITDPSHLRVLLKNSSPYRVKMEGPITGWVEPYSAVELHTECPGKIDGVGHAYKTIGKADKGGSAMFYMGERTFSIRTDGKNRIYDGESYDDVVIISSFRKYPNMPLGVEKTHVVSSNPCSILLPDVLFQFGK